MTCNNCNNILPDNSAFCPFCGTKIEAPMMEPESPQIEMETPQVSPATNFSTQTPPPTEPTIQKPNKKVRYCTRCGCVIDAKTKKCPACTQKHDHGRKKRLAVVLSILLAVSIVFNIVAICQMSYYTTRLLISEMKNSKIDAVQEENEALKKENSEILNSGYIQCSVTELYKNPQKYSGKKVAITSWKVVSVFNSETVVGAFYNMLLCDDTTHYKSMSSYGLKTARCYKYYTDCIQPYNTPYVGAYVVFDNVYKEIPDAKNKITIFGTFTYNPNSREGGYIGDPHVYHVDVEYYFVP